MTGRVTLSMLLALLMAAVCQASTDPGDALVPLRTIKGSTILSPLDPSISIRLPQSVQHVGSVRWPLYGVADCEIHVFVVADRAKRVRELYTIQFEAYLPNVPEYSYDYSTNTPRRKDGMDFFVRARFGRSDGAPPPDSDWERVVKLLDGKGFKLPAEMSNVRFVHLIGADKRKEMMFIYSEDLSRSGFSVAELMPGGKAAASWPRLERDLIDRAERKVTIRPFKLH